MALAIYMDHHIPRAITTSLRHRDIEVITAFEDSTHEWEDARLLDRAFEIAHVLFTRDDDLLAESAYRQREGISFYGVIYAHQLHVSISRCIRDLEFIATAGDPDDVVNQVLYLPF